MHYYKLVAGVPAYSVMCEALECILIVYIGVYYGIYIVLCTLDCIFVALTMTAPCHPIF